VEDHPRPTPWRARCATALPIRPSPTRPKASWPVYVGPQMWVGPPRRFQARRARGGSPSADPPAPPTPLPCRTMSMRQWLPSRGCPSVINVGGVGDHEPARLGAGRVDVVEADAHSFWPISGRAAARRRARRAVKPSVTGRDEWSSGAAQRVPRAPLAVSTGLSDGFSRASTPAPPALPRVGGRRVTTTTGRPDAPRFTAAPSPPRRLLAERVDTVVPSSAGARLHYQPADRMISAFSAAVVSERRDNRTGVPHARPLGALATAT